MTSHARLGNFRQKFCMHACTHKCNFLNVCLCFISVVLMQCFYEGSMKGHSFCHKLTSFKKHLVVELQRSQEFSCRKVNVVVRMVNVC